MRVDGNYEWTPADKLVWSNFLKTSTGQKLQILVDHDIFRDMEDLRVRDFYIGKCALKRMIFFDIVGEVEIPEKDDAKERTTIQEEE